MNMKSALIAVSVCLLTGQTAVAEDTRGHAQHSMTDSETMQAASPSDKAEHTLHTWLTLIRIMLDDLPTVIELGAGPDGDDHDGPSDAIHSINPRS